MTAARSGTILLFAGAAAAAEGRYKLSEKLFQNEFAAAQRAELPETANTILVDQALAERKLGFVEQARTTLKRVASSGDESGEFAEAEAELGNVSFAERFLAAHADSTPDTLLTYVMLPRIRAAVAMERRRPLEAIEALESSKPYEMRDYAIASLRGEAYLANGEAESAVREYRKILDNPGVDPTSMLYPLAHLGAARACAQEGNKAGSKGEYESFLASWKDADPDVPVLQRARREYAQLQ